MEVIDVIAPLKEIRVKGNSKPWFDGDVIERINVRDKLKKKFNKTKLQVDYDNFKTAQKQAAQIIKRKKCDYVKDQLKENIAKPSKLWQTLKSIGLSSKSKNEAKTCLKDNGVLYFEPRETSGIFKKFYENLAQSLVDKLPPAPNKYNNETTKAYYDNMNINNQLKFKEIGADQIYEILKQTNASKAPGIDKLSGTFIRDGAEFLANPLSQIINLSIASSTFPDLCIAIQKQNKILCQAGRCFKKSYPPLWSKTEKAKNYLLYPS